MNMVTNMPVSLFSARALFMRTAMSAGTMFSEARVRKSLALWAMKRLAGTPLPLTSPTQK